MSSQSSVYTNHHTPLLYEKSDWKYKKVKLLQPSPVESPTAQFMFSGTGLLPKAQ